MGGFFCEMWQLVDYGPEKRRLDFASDPEHILDLIILPVC